MKSEPGAVATGPGINSIKYESEATRSLPLPVLTSLLPKKLIDEIALLFYYPLQHWKGGDPKAYEFKSQ
jgi:hypothetical protein